jgi:hypothetical protein
LNRMMIFLLGSSGSGTFGLRGIVHHLFNETHRQHYYNQSIHPQSFFLNKGNGSIQDPKSLHKHAVKYSKI